MNNYEIIRLINSDELIQDIRKLILISIFFSLFILSANSQDSDPYWTGVNPCSKKIFMKSKSFDQYPYENYSEYIKSIIKKDQKLKNHIVFSDKYLKPFQNVIGFDNCIYLKSQISKNDIVSFYCTTKQIKLKLKPDPDVGYIDYWEDIGNQLGHPVIGELEGDSIVEFSIFDKFLIKVNENVYDAPDSLYNEFINPNVNLKFHKINSIQAYYNNKQKAIYIYIMGLPLNIKPKQKDSFKTNELNTTAASFIVKIIFDLQTKKFYKFNPGREYFYGYWDCPEGWWLF